MRVFAFTLALVSCSCKHNADTSSPATLSVIGDDGRGVVALTPKDEILDGNGRVVGRVEWQTPEVIVGDTKEALTYEVEATGVSVVTPMGTFHTFVADGKELSVNGKPAGKLIGFAPSKEGWRHLAAIVLAIPMLPIPARQATHDAAEEMGAPPRPPPPPKQ